MLKSFAKMSVAVMAAMFVCAALALAGKEKTIQVYYDTVLPSGQTLKAGKYAVHVDESVHKVQFLHKGKVVAETPCNCIDKGKKNGKSECIFIKDSRGDQKLQQVELSGDTKTIVIEGKGM
jgi:uncharacterized protein (DUF2141 family)